MFGMDGAYIAEIFSDIDYAAFLEWGTSRMPTARLHFSNTINAGNNVNIIVKYIEDEMRKSL